jgi:hypothetical protein
MSVKFNVSLVDDNQMYSVKQQAAAEMLNRVWNSPEFMAEVLAVTSTVCTGWWRWKKCSQVLGFSSTKDTNAQVYAKLMSKEVANIRQDIVSCSNRKVIGYEDGTDITKVCSGWDSYLEVYGVVNNLAHEYCHTLGYSHSSASDISSVPYKVGVIAERVARKLYAKP